MVVVLGFSLRKAFQSKNIDRVPNFSSFEHHTISLSFHGRSLILGSLYRPLLPQFKSFQKISCLILIFFCCGDFNIHLDTASPLVSKFKSVVDPCCLTQYIEFPTHLHGHTLDLLWNF